jgi:hypothetical protein
MVNYEMLQQTKTLMQTKVVEQNTLWTPVWSKPPWCTLVDYAPQINKSPLNMKTQQHTKMYAWTKTLQ